MRLALRTCTRCSKPVPRDGKRIETAYKTKDLLGRFFRYATNQYKELPIRNIPADLETKEILGKRPDKNLAILERPKFGALLRGIERYNGQPATVAALRLMPHVLLRSTELRDGRWSEANFKTAQWRIRLRPCVIRPMDMFQSFDGSGDDFDTGYRFPGPAIPAWRCAIVPLAFGRIVPLIAHRLPP